MTIVQHQSLIVLTTSVVRKIIQNKIITLNTEILILKIKVDLEFSYSELIGECKQDHDCDTAHEFCHVSDHSCRSLSGQLYFPFLLRVSSESYYMICMYNIYLKNIDNFRSYLVLQTT